MSTRIINNLGSFFFPLIIKKQSNTDTQDPKYIVRTLPDSFTMQNQIRTFNKLKDLQLTTNIYNFETYEELSFAFIDENTQSIEYSQTIKDQSNNKQFILHYPDILTNNLTTLLASLSSSRIYISLLFEVFRTILPTIKTLNDNQIVHNNIKPSSIVFDMLERCYLTNFSFSILVDDNLTTTVSKHFAKYDPTYSYWPLELHLLAYMEEKQLNSVSAYTIDLLVSEVVSSNKFYKVFNKVQEFVTEGKLILQRYVNKDKKEIVS